MERNSLSQLQNQRALQQPAVPGALGFEIQTLAKPGMHQFLPHFKFRLQLLDEPAVALGIAYHMLERADLPRHRMIGCINQARRTLTERLDDLVSKERLRHR